MASFDPPCRGRVGAVRWRRQCAYGLAEPGFEFDIKPRRDMATRQPAGRPIV